MIVYLRKKRIKFFLLKEFRKTYWKTVGKAVTRKRPLNAGDVVTSIWAVLMPISFDHSPNFRQAGARFLHAGHHGA